MRFPARAFLGLVMLFSGAAFAASTEFTYQGQLWDNGAAVSGTYDFQFVL